MRTLSLIRACQLRSNLLNTISEKKNRQPEALVMGVVRGAVMTDVSSKKSVLKCIGKWIHQLFFAPLKKPRHVLWQGRSKLRASFLRGISAKKSAFHSKKSIGKMFSTKQSNNFSNILHFSSLFDFHNFEKKIESIHENFDFPFLGYVSISSLSGFIIDGSMCMTLTHFWHNHMQSSSNYACKI